jgi:hypothetical protein
MNPLPRNPPPSAHMAAVLAQLWLWFRLGLCIVAVPCSLVFLYSCFYL